MNKCQKRIYIIKHNDAEVVGCLGKCGKILLSESRNDCQFQESRNKLTRMTPAGHAAHMEEVNSAYKISIGMRAARKIGCRSEVLKKSLSKMWTRFS
jgi:hypothetical protein